MRRSLLALLIAGVSLPVLATPIISNTSFETNNLANGTFAYGSADSGWTMTSGGGLSKNHTAWGGTAKDGDTFAFLQNASSISQGFSSDGNYDLDFAFYLEYRWPGYSENQNISVLLDGNVIDANIYASNSWSQYSINNISIGAGNHTLTFQGNFAYSTQGDDSTIFLDKISMTATPVLSTSVPEPGALALLSVGLLGFVVSRRNTKKALSLH